MSLGRPQLPLCTLGFSMSVPTGIVTFLFLDVEGSTHLSEDSPDSRRALLMRHDVIVRNAIESRDECVFVTGADAFSTAFQPLRDCLDAAL